MMVTPPKAPGRITAPFGAANRQRLITAFLDGRSEAAWLSVYGLLLWTDKTTGLAHCYESDKCQPGKPWHARSLRFHDWVAQSLAVAPRHVQQRRAYLPRGTARGVWQPA